MQDNNNKTSSNLNDDTNTKIHQPQQQQRQTNLQQLSTLPLCKTTTITTLALMSTYRAQNTQMTSHKGHHLSRTEPSRAK
ncbi:unnamed protein product, partial [Ceratitis capitata]